MINFCYTHVALGLASGLADQLTLAETQRIGNLMQAEMQRQMEEALFGGREMPKQTAITEDVVLARRKPNKHPFGIINFEDVG